MSELATLSNNDHHHIPVELLPEAWHSLCWTRTTISDINSSDVLIILLCTPDGPSVRCATGKDGWSRTESNMN